MGDRATIAFCASDGTEWARIYIHNRGGQGREVLEIYIHNRGGQGREVLEEFFQAEAESIADGSRDQRWQQPDYLAARFVAWNSNSAGIGVGIVPVSHEQRWHWKVTCPSDADLDNYGDAAWPLVEQVKPEPMDRAKALRTAAWLVVLADPGGEEFEAVLAAVRST